MHPPHSNGTVYGDCSFGPVINLVALKLIPQEVRKGGRAAVGRQLGRLACGQAGGQADAL